MPLLCWTYFFAQQEHIRAEICPDAYKSSPEYLLVYLKPWMFLLLCRTYMTTSRSSSACKHASLPLCTLLCRNTRTDIADCMFRAELVCLGVVHWGAVLGKDWNVERKKKGIDWILQHHANHSQCCLAKNSLTGYSPIKKAITLHLSVCTRDSKKIQPAFLSYKILISYILSFVLGDAAFVSALVQKW